MRKEVRKYNPKYIHEAKAAILVEMKYMFTEAPARGVSTLPEPFKKAIENSRLWQWERKHGLENTGCLASLFPRDVTQDVSFTIWCGHDDGYHLNSVFGMRRAIAS